MIYTLRLSKRDLVRASDMLRYDSALEVRFEGDYAVIRTLRYTPARWRSFINVVPEVISEDKRVATSKLYEESSQFISGIKFAQKIILASEHPGMLVEDN